MPKTVQKTLTFPLSGVARKRGYRRQDRPYSAPWAVNVRGVGPLEARDRGGSRPGLTKVNANDFGAAISLITSVTSIDSSGDRYRDLVVICDGIFSYLRGSTVSTISSVLQWPDGQSVLWPDGQTVIFDATVATANPIGATNAYHAAERGGKLYLADSVLRVYDPNTGIIEPVLATDGTVPTAQPLICVYRDRLFLSGADHVFYASRTSDFTDWNLTAEMTDANRALAGQLEQAGMIGTVPKAMVPFRDKALAFACENDLWVLRGDPVTGTMVNVSASIGIISPEAWAMTADGLMAFLSNDGVYVWSIGDSDKPTRFSDERVPDELKNISPSTNIINMAYDPIGRGFHLFITPSSGTGTHWWLECGLYIWPKIISHWLSAGLKRMDCQKWFWAARTGICGNSVMRPQRTTERTYRAISCLGPSGSAQTIRRMLFWRRYTEYWQTIPGLLPGG